jgi:hypothetical protein
MKNVIFGALALLAVACNTGDATKSGEPAKGDSKKEQAGGDTKPAAATTKELKIDKLGLKCEVPSEVEASISSMGDSQMIMSSATVTVSLAKDTDPKTAADAKKEAADYTPKNIKEEKLGDGWFITFENTGSAGENFHLTMRRDIGGKSYMCNTMLDTAARRDEAIKLCKSLKQ